MRFEQALAAMREGKKIRRTCWNTNGYWTNHSLCEEAILAEDWEIYEEPKWEPEGGPWAVNSTGTVERWDSNGRRFFGCERKTKEAAEKARDKMRVFNRLLAYVDEHAPDYEPDWGDNSQWRVVYHHEHKLWVAEATINLQGADVYMPHEVARKLAEDLNSGRVVL